MKQIKKCFCLIAAKIKERPAVSIVSVLFLIIFSGFLFENALPNHWNISDKNSPEKNFQQQTADIQEGAGSDFLIPKDEGQHQNLQTEWWYFAGHLEDKNNTTNKFGITLIFHKNSPRIVFNLTDGPNQENFSALIYLDRYDALNEHDLKIINGSNYWISSDSGYRIHFEYNGKKIDLNLKPLKSPFVSSLSDDSLYSQQTRLEANGDLFFSPDRQYSVQGYGWAEHQGFRENLSWKTWRWYSLQLSNNVEIAFVNDLHLKDGNSSKKNVLFIFRDNEEKIGSQDYKIKDLKYWTHPKTNVRYPIKWQLDIPERNTRLIITSLAPNQVIDEAAGFYEGSCLVSGTFDGQNVTGRAQFEFMP